jgi:hypothetical protein
MPPEAPEVVATETPAAPPAPPAPPPAPDAGEAPVKTDAEILAEATIEEPGAAAETQAAPAASLDPKAERLRRATEAAEKAKRDWRAKSGARQTERQMQQALAERETELARVRGEAAAQRELIEAAQRDPLGFLQRMGLTADKVAKRAVEDGTPEAKIARLSAELEELKNGQAAKERAAADAAQQAQHAAHYAEQQGVFLRIASDEEKYPTLALHAKTRGPALFREAVDVAREAMRRSRGTYNPTARDVAKYLESTYAAIRGEAQPTSGPSKSGTTNPEPNGSATKTSGAKPSRTLTNSSASQKGTLPPDSSNWSDEQWKAHAMEQARVAGG